MSNNGCIISILASNPDLEYFPLSEHVLVCELYLSKAIRKQNRDYNHRKSRYTFKHYPLSCGSLFGSPQSKHAKIPAQNMNLQKHHLTTKTLRIANIY